MALECEHDSVLLLLSLQSLCAAAVQRWTVSQHDSKLLLLQLPQLMCVAADGSMGPPPGRNASRPDPSSGSDAPHHPEMTDELTFLRGVVPTDASGIAEFDSVVPGWYQGRTPHIHVKVGFPTLVA